MTPKYLVIHHSATTDSVIKDWDAIRRYHTSYRIDGRIVSKEVFAANKAAKNGSRFEEPWRDIGYHYGIERVNGVVAVQIGRSEDQTGAHCNNLGFNSKSLGICVVGNYDAKIPDAEVMEVLRGLVVTLMHTYSIPPENVVGHGEVQRKDPSFKEKPKTCPGLQFDMEAFRASLGGSHESA